MLEDNLEGWDGLGGGREVQEGGDVCIPVAESHGWHGRDQNNSVKQLSFN